MDAAKETELLSTVNDIGGDTDCILQMLRSVKEHHKEENTMDSNLAAALLANQNNRYNNGFDSPWMYLIWLAMFANRAAAGFSEAETAGRVPRLLFPRNSVTSRAYFEEIHDAPAPCLGYGVARTQPEF